MKKNKMMRAASALLIAVLLTTCAVSGTFAKYTTSDSGGDTARVAKWGVTVTANGDTFAETYAKTDGSFTLSANTVVSVNASDDATDDAVVAPGTNGNMTEMALSGTPEVAVRVTYDVTKFNLEGWMYDGVNEYCPIIFTVKTGGTSATYGTNDTTATNKYATVDELESAIKTLIGNYKAEYEALTYLNGKSNDVVDISWEWPYSVDDVHDARDTGLANQAILPSIEVEIKTTVTQID